MEAIPTNDERASDGLNVERSGESGHAQKCK